MSRYAPNPPRDRFGDPLMSIRRELNRMMNDFGRFTGPPPGGDARMALARVDMSETDDALDIEIEAPGVEERGLDLDLRGDILTIRAVREARRDVHERNWRMRERATSGVTRALTLPFAPEPDAISAHLEHGVLHVRVQKRREHERRSVRIPVRVAARGDEGAGPQGPIDPAI